MGTKVEKAAAEMQRISANITAYAEKHADEATGIVKGEEHIKALVDMSTELSEAKSAYEALSGAEAAEKAAKRPAAEIVHNPESQRETRSFSEQVLGKRDAYDGNWKLNEFRTGTKTLFQTISTSTGASYVPEDRLAPVVKPDHPLTVRDAFFMPGSTDSDLVTWYELTTDTNNAAAIAQGAAYGEDAFSWTKRTSNVRKVGTTLPVTEEALADYAQMVTILEGRMDAHVNHKEEVDLLWGTGNSDDLKGIFNQTGIKDASSVCSLAAADNYADIIRKMITASWAGGSAIGYYPTTVGMSPLIKQDIDLLKDDNKQYLFIVLQSASGKTIHGLNIVESTAFQDPDDTNDHYILVGSKMAGQIWDKESNNFEVGWVNAQFKEDEKTLKVRKRLASGLYVPASFVYYNVANVS